MVESPRHLAGIISVTDYYHSERDKNFLFAKFQWPIAKDYYTPLEHAIYECAMVSCSAIWVVVHHPIKHWIKRQQRWIIDPTGYFRARFFKYSEELEKRIPIFYISAKDFASPEQSIIQGCLTAYRIGNLMSKWAAPYKFYATFTNSIYDVSKFGYMKKNLRDPKKQFVLRHEGKTIKDGKRLGFTLFAEDVFEMHKNGFQSYEIKKNAKIHDIENYYELTDVNSYIDYMKSGLPDNVIQRRDFIFDEVEKAVESGKKKWINIGKQRKK